MASLHSIFQDIADIICDSPDKESLKLKIESDQFDWEKIVPVASAHLVIPLLYCKLKEKDLLEILPQDLLYYLEEITNQNRERNKSIHQEVNEISSLLIKHEIDHVFLKGVALLISGIYTDIGQRMIGDIDILVHPEQLNDAQKLLCSNGYEPIETTFGQNFTEHKHLARLIPKANLAAVEIHRKLLHKPVENQLQPIQILKNKRSVDTIAIPDEKDLLNHTVLNFEINDYGYYFNYLGLRNAYDALKLTAKELDFLDQTKYFPSFFGKVSVYFQIPFRDQKKYSVQFSTKRFLLKQKNRFIRNLINRFLSVWQFGSIIFKRFILFIMNSDYRRASLNDRKRILNLIQNKIKNLY